MNDNLLNTKILVCCHKQCDLPPDPDGIFLPIHVGAALSDIDLNMQRDDQLNGQPCDNISDKNKSYCELTALYWAWKNIEKLYPNISYIGLCHYRRFFYKLNKNIKKLNKNNCIVSKYNYFPWGLEVQYKRSHISDDFNTLQSVIHDLTPDYDKPFHDVFYKGNKTLYFNMFVCSKEIFIRYCEWLFYILNELESRINIENYSVQQKRVFGFMAERLLLVFLYKNKTKLIHCNIYNTEKNEKKNNIKDFILFLRNELSFFFNKSWN